ncbi:MAG: HAD-IIA family hydrolase [Candidatus Thalassarchaeaceae archaeon]|nr:HAD-IIA family hydrolase [Candidatus Thalassarchaeaceae archaeon]
MDSSLKDIDAVFLDLDGTIYLGGDLIHGALDFLDRCDAKGVQRYFLSNNSSRSVTQYVSKLQGLGIPATTEEVLLSTHDLIAWLNESNISRLFLVGTEGMSEMLQDAGFMMDEDEPEIVVLGYDTEISYDKISTASILLHRGVPMVASHPDMVCPSPDGGLPDTGAYMAMFEATTGVRPMHVCGKPEPGMILHRIEALGLKPGRCAMVGDRLYTDMAMATRAGVKGILVLSGEATEQDVVVLPEGAEQCPDLVVGSVDELLR